ncbi:MAG: hypothetical protein HY331_18930 [Chloroflexi bacterium]|nr:hypothetical protein [Chloroflexota bacterium]
MSYTRIGSVRTRDVFLTGLAAVLTGSALGMALTRTAWPVVVSAIKQGLILRENVRARVAELREDVEDLVAAAEHEYEAERSARHGESSGTEP